MALFTWLKYIGTKLRNTGVENSRSSSYSDRWKKMTKSNTEQLVVCVSNEGYPASLEKRKIYISLRDIDAERKDLLRVIDESGDDYLYPKTFFRPIALPLEIKKAVLAAA